MSDKKGFSLVELIVVLVIIAVLSALAIPNYIAYMQQGAAKTAQDNLITIYNAEKNYFLSHEAYCANKKPVPQLSCAETPTTKCAADLTSINCNMSLNLTDPSFSYKCVKGGAAAGGFKCTATNLSNNAFTIVLTNTPAVILTGGTGCATSNGGACNPSCTDAANPSYCPS